mgnify:CR=1 FL=1
MLMPKNKAKCQNVTKRRIFFVFVRTCVAAVIETTNDGTLEQHKFIIRPSAINTIRFPLGQIT